MKKNPGVWIVITLAVIAWNLYELFGPQPETPPQSIVILNWFLVVCGVAGLVGAVMQLAQNKGDA
jgi:hypothetical protein